MKIIIVNVYFGRRPQYFDLFLLSCGFNSNIRFLFIVDFEVFDYVPDNVTFVKSRFSDISRLFQSMYDFELCLDSPYKLTDYQPAYGELLRDYIAGFDWWGHCDFDMLFGDLSSIIQKVNQGLYVKIFKRGHLTLYKNLPEVNSVYKLGAHKLDYRYVFSTDKFCNFDESNGIDKIFAEQGLPVFRDELIADIKPWSSYLFMTKHANNIGQYFVLEGGRLFCERLFRRRREFVYIHLQKRQLKKLSFIDFDSPVFINQFGIFSGSERYNQLLVIIISFFPNFMQVFRFYMMQLKKLLSRLS